MKTIEETKKHYTEKFFENHTQDLNCWLEHIIKGGYIDGYNTVLQAYENLFGLDERYWKLVNFLNKNGY